MNGRKAFLLSALVVAWMVVVTLLLWPRSSPPMESVSSYSSEVIPIDSETGPGFASRGQLAISAPGRADSRFNVTVSYNASGLGAIEVRVAMGRILPGSFSNTSASAASLSFAVVPEPRQGHSDAWVNVTVARGGESASLSVKYQATRVIMLTVKEVGGRMPRIDFIPDDDRAALVIFYSKATNESMASMRKGTKRVVTFMDVDYVWREWPSGFDPNTKTPLESFHRRCRYCYQHMCWFWFVRVWKLPILDGVKLAMRLDTDSTLERMWLVNPFDAMEARGASYMANVKNGWLFREPAYVVHDLANHADRFVSSRKLTIANTKLWDGIVSQRWTGNLLHFYNNFQLVRMSFIRRRDVWQWIDFVDKSHGIFLHRWGDSPLITYLVAMFCPPEEFMFRDEVRMPYHH